MAERDGVAGTIGRIAPLFIAHAVGTANITLVAALLPSIEEFINPATAKAVLLTSFGTMLGPTAFGIAVESTGYASAWTARATLLLLGAALFAASAPAAVRR